MSLGEFYHPFKEYLVPIIYSHFRKYREQGIIYNLFYEAGITRLLNWKRQCQNKTMEEIQNRQTKVYHEYRHENLSI